MFIITPNQDIILTRGDTARFEATILNDDGTAYVPQAGDVVTFSVRAVADGPVLITKPGPSITLDPADTAHLPNGGYIYDVDIAQANGDVSTFIPQRRLALVSEV